MVTALPGETARNPHCRLPAQSAPAYADAAAGRTGGAAFSEFGQHDSPDPEGKKRGCGGKNDSKAGKEKEKKSFL